MDEKEALSKVWELWTSERRDEIAPLVESEGTETDILKRYLSLQNHVHWEKKDLEAVLALSRFAVEFARRAGNKEAENVILFNVASFTLPWWSDSLQATPWFRDQGLSAARRIISLRKDLGKSPVDVSQGHWILGAHHLYRGDVPDAVFHFNRSLALAREAGDKNLEASALEGLGRTRVRLVPDDRDWGFESLGEARALYGEAGDAFNLKEVERFLGEPPSSGEPPAAEPA